MLKEKRGYAIRTMFAIIGSAILLASLYMLNKENFLYGGVLGIVGILLITISIFPYIKAIQ